jgi:hypothetical protein
MEAQLALNQLVYDADQRRPRYVGVSNMHEVSEHAEEAQRLAQQLLHRMTSGFGTHDSPEGRRLPPLRAALKYGAAARPSLAAAKKYAFQPSPTRSPQQSPLRQNARSSAQSQYPRELLERQQHEPSHEQHLVQSSPQSYEQQQHHTEQQRQAQSSEKNRVPPHQHLHQQPQQANRQPQPTRSLRPMALQPPLPASTNKPSKVAQRQPANRAQQSRIPPLDHPHAQPSYQQFEDRRRPATPPTAQLVETEAVERSILITVWELERSKLIARISKAIASYFSWMMEDLENEMLAARELIEEEEEHIWATTIWNKVVIKNSGFRLWQVDNLLRQEESGRAAISAEESATVISIPARAGHDKYIFFENEYRSRCEVRDAEESRRTIITTKFKLLEAVVDESNLRKWIETLEHEMFANNVFKPLQSILLVNEGASMISRRETRERASIVADLDNEFLYFDRYSTNLSSLCHDTKFWNEKRDIEYHENLRRLFSAASEEQERQEMLKAFFSFMMAKGAVLSKRALDSVLDNEWIRRGLMQTMEQRERSTIEIAFLHLKHDAINDLRTKQHEDAKAAVTEYDGRAQSTEDMVHHESIRRGFLMVQQQRERNGVEALIRSLENASFEADGESEGSSSAQTAADVKDPFDAHEANRRGYLEAAEAQERRSYAKLSIKVRQYLLREAELSMMSSEQVRRVFTQRDEQAAWRILCDVGAADHRDTFERSLSHISDNEALRRSILMASETHALGQIVAAKLIHTDSDEDSSDACIEPSRPTATREAQPIPHRTTSDKRVDATSAITDDKMQLELRDEAAAIFHLKMREEELPQPTPALNPSDEHEAVTFTDVRRDELRREKVALVDLEAREREIEVSLLCNVELRQEASELARLRTHEEELESRRSEQALFHESFVLGVLKSSLEEVDQRQVLFNEFQTNRRD